MCRSAATLAAASLVLAATHAACASAEAPSEVADASYARTVILTSPQLELRAVCRASATMADRRFIGFEIDNRTGAPLVVNAISLSWNAQWADASTGRSLWSGSVDSGLAEALRQRLGTPIRFSLPAGTTTLLDVPSRVTGNDLGVGPFRHDEPLRVTLTALAQASPLGGTLLETSEPLPAVSFTWSVPDEAGLAALAAEAQELVVRFESMDFLQDNRLSSLLRDDRVAARIPKQLLLDALGRRLSAPRQYPDALPLAECLGRLHATDPDVHAFLLDALRRRQAGVIAWLWMVSSVWSDEFLPLLREMPDEQGTAARLLLEHAPQLVPESPVIVVQPAGRAARAARRAASAASWHATLSSPAIGAPVLAGQAALLQASDNAIHAMRLDDGAPLWTARVTSEHWTLRCITPAGRMAIVAVEREVEPLSARTELVALDSGDGHEIWRSRVEALARLPGCATAGLLLLGTSSGWTLLQDEHEMLALDAVTGAPRWRHALIGRPIRAPVATRGTAAVLTEPGFQGVEGGSVEAFVLATGESVTLAPPVVDELTFPAGSGLEGGKPRIARRPYTSLIAACGRFVTGHEHGDDHSLAAWHARAEAPDWKVPTPKSLDAASCPLAAGAVVLLPSVTSNSAMVRAVDGSSGRMRWTANERVLAATSSAVVTLAPPDPRDAAGESATEQTSVVTWRAPVTGDVLATRAESVPAACAASGKRLVCAGSRDVVSLLPVDDSPMLEWGLPE